LAWLVDGDTRCSFLPVGTYSVDVKLTANPGAMIERSETITSNPFMVTR
jgi:hypothetical protein